MLFLKSETCVCAILLRFSISVLLMLPDNYCETGHHSQFLRCFKDCETSPSLNTQHHTLGILMEAGADKLEEKEDDLDTADLRYTS